jgi:CRP-like cAMP-binding protein
MRWRTRADGRLGALRRLPELAHLSGSDLRRLLGQFDEITVPAGTVIARAGRLCAQYVVVLDGRLETRTDRASAAVTAGASCGWDAMCERGVSPATVLAASDARLLVMGRAQFRAVPTRVRGQRRNCSAPAQRWPLRV